MCRTLSFAILPKTSTNVTIQSSTDPHPLLIRLRKQSLHLDASLFNLSMPTHRFLFSSSFHSSLIRTHGHHLKSRYRWISSTAHLDGSWMNKITGVFTGRKDTDSSQTSTQESFTLLRFAEELSKARKIGSFKNYIVGRSSAVTFGDAFEKQEAIIRFLGGFDPTGENILPTQKQEAAKRCNCTIIEVENTLAKFTWAKEAQKKIEKLKEEGKPLPSNLNEVQKLMGSTPMDLARSNMAKSGQISRNALCPCGSKKRYKRCCGKDEEINRKV